MRSITSSRSRYDLNKDGIIIQQAINSQPLSLELAKEEVATFIQLTGGKKRPLLVIINYNNKIPKEVRKYYISDFLKNYGTAVAFYTESKMMQMIGSFFLGVYKTPYPFKIFNNKNAALEWLKGYVV